MKVSEMPYSRNEKQYCIDTIKGLIDEFNNAHSVEEQLKVSDKFDTFLIDVMTMNELSYLRFTQNTKDEFYAKEHDYWDEALPEIDFYANEFNKCYVNSKFSDQLRKHFPPVFFKNIELEIASSDERLIPYNVEENKLISEYTKLMSNIVVDFNGEKLPPSGMAKYSSNADRQLRKDAQIALGNAYKEHEAELDEIFDKLVKIRTQEGRILGYDNFSPVGYCRMKRNCYTKEDIAKFRGFVKKYFVPLTVKIKNKVARDLKIDQMYLYDNTVMTVNEPKIVGGPEYIFQQGAKMYEEMSPITGKLFDHMVEIEAFDAMSREGKWGGGYCMNIDKYKTPVILSNFNGSLDDIGVLTHEFGHALAADRSFEIPFVQVREPSMETAEVHSMSMEFFTYPWMKNFFGKDTQDYIFTHMGSALSFLPYGTIVDYFQQTVYDNPDMTPSERNEFWKKIESEFLPYMSNAGLPFYDEGRRWQRQAHIFETPFYYIDYCLAQFTAFQFLALSHIDRDEAFKKYMAFLVKGGSQPFTQLLAEAGLKSPFEEESFVEISNTIAQMLDLQ